MDLVYTSVLQFYTEPLPAPPTQFDLEISVLEKFNLNIFG